MKKSIKKMASLLAAATIVFSSVSAFATAPAGWTTSADFSKDYWRSYVNWVNNTEQNGDQTYDYGGGINGFNNARANFDVSYVENDNGRNYVKLVPKTDKLGTQGDALGLNGDLTQKFGKVTGKSHLSLEFSISDAGISGDRSGGKPMLGLRYSDSVLSGLSLITSNAWEKGGAFVAIDSYDTQWPGNLDGKKWVAAGTWCRYDADIDFYTKKAVATITNADTGEVLVGPKTVTIPDSTTSNSFTVQMFAGRYASATICVGDLVFSKDTFVCDNASKKIDVTDSTVTASVKMANDVATDLRNATYGVNGANTSEPELILVQYDANGKYLAATSKPLAGMLSRDKSGKGERVLHEMSVTMDKAEGYSYAKAFLWDSFSGLEPFTTAWTNK